MRCLAGICGVAIAAATGLVCSAEDAAPRHDRNVRIEVLIADLSGTPEGNGEMTVERFKDLEKQGKFESTVKLGITTLDGSAATVQYGERAPVAMGKTVAGPNRAVAVNYTVQNVGTMLSVTPRVDADSSVLLELKIERSRIVGGQENNDPNAFKPATILTIIADTKVRVAPGKASVTAAQQAEGQESRQSWIIVTAEVAEAK